MTDRRALLTMLFRLAHRQSSKANSFSRSFSLSTRPRQAGNPCAGKAEMTRADFCGLPTGYAASRGFSSCGGFLAQEFNWSSRSHLVDRSFPSGSANVWMNPGGKHQIHTSNASRSERDFYEVLGVSPGASPGEIKRAYYQLAKKLHPDSSKEVNANEKFQELQKAYSTLKDPEKKRMYDQMGHDNYERMDSAGGDPSEGGFGGFSGPSVHDIFNAFMGGGRRGGFYEDMFTNSGFVAQVQQQIQISFMEAVEGCSRELNVSGAKQKVKVEIEAGVESGDMLSVRPTPHLELILNVVVKPHKIYKREGLNIFRIVNVDVIDAILGTEVTVETVRGKTVRVKVPECTQDNDRLRVPGEGVRAKKKLGDYFLLVKLKTPSEISKRQKELLLDFQNEASKMGRAA